ncbi:MAG: hypothetical protein K6B72_03170 [Lachnospiraceae bacterium]|nr:hypothetical protein [Lachnospiraceae bacterium]
MISYLFFVSGQERRNADDAAAVPDRVYVSAEDGAKAYAASLFPEKRAVEITSFSADPSADGNYREHILAAFDTLVGNFRVLYQDAERTVRIAFVLPETVTAVILDARLNGGLSAAEGISPGRVITTRGEGGRLALM